MISGKFTKRLPFTFALLINPNNYFYAKTNITCNPYVLYGGLFSGTRFLT